MGQVRERAPRCFAPFGERLGWNQQGRHERTADEQHAHDQRRSAKQLSRIVDASGWPLRRVPWLSLDERHHRNAGLEP